jgi:hypothetical protein
MPYRTINVKAPLFMTHKAVKVYHVFRHDDATAGDLRTYAYTLDPFAGSDDDRDGKVTFDVRKLSTWQEPPHPPFLTGEGDTPANRKNCTLSTRTTVKATEPPRARPFRRTGAVRRPMATLYRRTVGSSSISAGTAPLATFPMPL